MNCPDSVRSRTEPEASALLRDARGAFFAKENHPNIPGQAHVKFADGNEREIPFPCNPKERKTDQISLVPFVVNGRLNLLRE
jgi:hypothetical protein